LPFKEPATAWPDFLESLANQRRGVNLTGLQVRGTQLAAIDDGILVGRTSLRFELNDFFATVGGHVGYGVVPAQRRKGYALEILRQALIILRAEGVDRVLVTCKETNLASATVIERNGGVYESSVAGENGESPTRRYWIA